MSKQMYLRTFITLFLILLIFFICTHEELNLRMVQNNIKNAGILAPFVFIFVYSLCPVIFIPITPMSILGGALFGQYWGTFFSVSGATLGAGISFLISRYILNDYVQSKLPVQMISLQNNIKKLGWKFICLARITPFIPFNLQNYFFGVSKIKFSTFMWASFLSLIPGTFLYTYIGDKGTNLLNGNRQVLINIIISLCLLLILSIIPYLIYKKTKEKNF